MQTKKYAKENIQRAEQILEKSYKITGELKLLPVVLQRIQTAVEKNWKTTRKKKKPQLLMNLEKLMHFKKNATVEFTRKNALILCSPRYKIKDINETMVRKYLNDAKKYIKKGDIHARRRSPSRRATKN